jgi:hypothetical protein
MTEPQVILKLKKVIPDLMKTGEYDSDDCYSKKFNTYIEIKCRRKHYDELGIQKDKWDHLTQYKKCRFIVQTPKGMWSWDLHKMQEPTWYRRLGPTSTDYKQYSIVDECWKDIGYLNIKDATDISYLLS